MVVRDLFRQLLLVFGKILISIQPLLSWNDLQRVSVATNVWLSKFAG